MTEKPNTQPTGIVERQDMCRNCGLEPATETTGQCRACWNEHDLKAPDLPPDTVVTSQRAIDAEIAAVVEQANRIASDDRGHDVDCSAVNAGGHDPTKCDCYLSQIRSLATEPQRDALQALLAAERERGRETLATLTAERDEARARLAAVRSDFDAKHADYVRERDARFAADERITGHLTTIAKLRAVAEAAKAASDWLRTGAGMLRDLGEDDDYEQAIEVCDAVDSALAAIDRKEG